MSAANPEQLPQAHFLARARHADERAAISTDPEHKATWSDIAAVYRGLAALAAPKPGRGR